jgi:leucyl-tRNA synthetase
MTKSSTEHPHETNPERYNAKRACAIECCWQNWWAEQNTYQTSNPGEPGFDPDKRKFFCLDMFPYPSGAGLHVGHPEGYTATDIISRLKHMQGFHVLRPMGWDAFGLPAEQHAINTGEHPAKFTRATIDNFRRQLQRFGFSYDWSREFATIDEGYYKWTQWIFLQIYNAWFDPQQLRARPIAELVEEFSAGSREVKLNPDAAEYAGAGDLPGGTRIGDWNTLDEETQRMVIDSYRLAYVGLQTVNWCPKLGTALANEEVIDGRSERGGHPVLRKPMRQWMFRITAYADRLLDGLTDLDWPHSTKTQQAEWIGRSEGAEVEFPIQSATQEATGESLRVFTTRPDTIFGATYMVVAPEHPLVDQVLDDPTPETPTDELRSYVEAARNRTDVERQEAKEKTGVFTGLSAKNPATGEPIPIWTSDYVLMGYGTGAIMAVPAQDQRDWDFATKFNLPIVRTVEPPEDFDGEAWTGEGKTINSDFLNGLDVEAAKKRIIEWLEDKNLGMHRITYRLRDWLFSRQRYWGEPFPIVWDPSGNHHPVSEDTLPVILPDMADYAPVESDDPQPLLGKATDWVATTAGETGVEGFDPDTPMRRETNTMPGWAGSCWYYLRYCDPHNDERFVGEDAERYWMGEHGVDLYIGGAEHAVLHLLYTRFWHKVLYDLGHVSTPEPFHKLFHQGMILSHAYQRSDKSLVPIDQIENTGTDDKPAYIETATGETVTQINAKMSKSLKNVVNPDDVIEEYGADTFRLYEMYMGPLDAAKPWNTRDIIGLYRFLQRAWRLLINEQTGAVRTTDTPDPDIEKNLHRTIHKVTGDIERLSFNTAIAALIEFVNAADILTGDQADRFVRTLAPFTPHIAEELWQRLGRQQQLGSVALQTWPTWDDAMLVDDEIEIPVQILGKLRSKITVPADADETTMRERALADDRIAKLLEGKTVRKVIVVPGRLVNIVAN